MADSQPKVVVATKDTIGTEEAIALARLQGYEKATPKIHLALEIKRLRRGLRSLFESENAAVGAVPEAVQRGRPVLLALRNHPDLLSQTKGIYSELGRLAADTDTGHNEVFEYSDSSKRPQSPASPQRLV